MKTVEEQAKIIVKLVVGGKYDTEIFNELWEAKAIKTKGYCGLTTEEQEKLIPHFCDFIVADQLRVLEIVKKKLLKKMKNSNNTYLKTLRILKGIEAVGDVDEVKKSSNKIKFCLYFFDMAYKAALHEEDKFKIISLLDDRD